MVDRAKLDKQLAAAIKREEKKAGICAGSLYRVNDGKGGWLWYQTDLTFYPSVKWWVTQFTDLVQGKPIKGTRVELTDEFKTKLENWL